MFSLISSALIALALLMFFMTPVGLCLLLASPFWTVGMDVVFYFVDNQYPDTIVAVVSAVVALLLIIVVRFIWRVLLLQGGPYPGDEAVVVAYPVSAAVAGKYGMSFDALVADEAASLSSSSVSGSRPNQAPHEYRFSVGGSVIVTCPLLVSPESDAVSADLSLDESRMPEVEDETYCKHAKGLKVASNCDSPALPVDRKLVFLSSAFRSIDFSDGTFVASASNVTETMNALDAVVGGSCVPDANPSGEAAGNSSTTDSGADNDFVAAACCGDTLVGTVRGTCDTSVGFSDAIINSATSGDVQTDGASFASLVCPFVLSSSRADGDLIPGKKRLSDGDFALCAHQEQAKKRKVAAIAESSLLPVFLEASATASAGAICAGTVTTPAPTVEPMDICVPSHPMPMDIDSPAALVSDDMDDVLVDFPGASTSSHLMVLNLVPSTTAMDVDPYGLCSPVCQPFAMDWATDDGDLFSFGLPAATVASTAAPPLTASTPAERRVIARPRGPSSALRRQMLTNVV
ncbi:DNA replication protein psf2 [Mucor velutinosus]|uniref:DNA replication protein psf2 n=1 Tax=Mucor velutinosus TaxID=708070 RepID=A0AAN7HQG2_9FUNG|nr:DNA replication protein psf2 [Mucor velutinosus]